MAVEAKDALEKAEVRSLQASADFAGTGEKGPYLWRLYILKPFIRLARNKIMRDP